MLLKHNVVLTFYTDCFTTKTRILYRKQNSKNSLFLQARTQHKQNHALADIKKSLCN